MHYLHENAHLQVYDPLKFFLLASHKVTSEILLQQKKLTSSVSDVTRGKPEGHLEGKANPDLPPSCRRYIILINIVLST